MLVTSRVQNALMTQETTRTHSEEIITRDPDFWMRETISLLALSTLPGIGYWTLRNLADADYSFNEVLKCSSAEEFGIYLSKASSKMLRLTQDWSDLQKKLWEQGQELRRELSRAGVLVIHARESRFPKSLLEIADPPQWIFVQGDWSILHDSSVAVVGTRQPSTDGIFLANYVSACIPAFNTVTVSGLANGIDQIIHQQSIRFQAPTIAVLGTGILKNYPSGSESLRDAICANGGAVVTEYLPNQTYSGENFVRRNRLQAGLAKVLIPAAWKSQSGTAHTVRYANASSKVIVCLRMPDWTDKEHPELLMARELGAEVFTVPDQGNDFIDFVRSRLVGNSAIMGVSDDQLEQVNSQVTKLAVLDNATNEVKNLSQSSEAVGGGVQMNLFEALG
jgi:DNA processing protein